MTNRFAPYPSQRKTTCSVQGCHIQLLASSLAKHVRDKHPEAHELAQQRKMKTQGTLMFARPEPVPSSSNAVPSTSTRPVFLRSHANIVHDDPVTEMHQDTTGLETDASTSTVPEHVIQVDDRDHIIDIPDTNDVPNELTPTLPLSQTFSVSVTHRKVHGHGCPKATASRVGCLEPDNEHDG